METSGRHVSFVITLSLKAECRYPLRKSRISNNSFLTDSLHLFASSKKETSTKRVSDTFFFCLTAKNVTQQLTNQLAYQVFHFQNTIF